METIVFFFLKFEIINTTQLQIPKRFKETATSLVQFTDEDLKDIISKFTFRKVFKKELLLNFGQVSNEVIFIERGVLREYYLDEHGNQKTTWILAEGVFTYSLSSFMEQKGSKYRIEALEDGEIYTISKAKYESLTLDNPKVLLYNFLIQQAYLFNYEYRMELLRCNNAMEKYLNFIEREGNLLNRVADKFIASYLNMTAPTLSKTRKKIMEEEKNTSRSDFLS